MDNNGKAKEDRLDFQVFYEPQLGKKGWILHIGKFWKICKKCLLTNDSVLNTESVPQKFLTNPSKLRIWPMQNSYCDARNFDSVELMWWYLQQICLNHETKRQTNKS
jgi:hypothetical protein